MKCWNSSWVLGGESLIAPLGGFPPEEPFGEQLSEVTGRAPRQGGCLPGWTGRGEPWACSAWALLPPFSNLGGRDMAGNLSRVVGTGGRAWRVVGQIQVTGSPQEEAPP